MKIIKIPNCNSCIYCSWKALISAVCEKSEFCIDNPDEIDKRCELEDEAEHTLGCHCQECQEEYRENQEHPHDVGEST
jgi:hypothetical protein